MEKRGEHVLWMVRTRDRSRAILARGVDDLPHLQSTAAEEHAAGADQDRVRQIDSSAGCDRPRRKRTHHSTNRARPDR